MDKLERAEQHLIEAQKLLTELALENYTPAKRLTTALYRDIANDVTRVIRRVRRELRR